jgi:hypothetical protein
MKLNFPSTLHKELQNVIAVVCLETIFQNEKANKLELERMISDFYHHVSHKQKSSFYGHFVVCVHIGSMDSITFQIRLPLIHH